MMLEDQKKVMEKMFELKDIDDLNEINQVELLLPNDKYEEYGNLLIDMVGKRAKTPTDQGRLFLSAPAELRREAILKVMGFWKENAQN